MRNVRLLIRRNRIWGSTCCVSVLWRFWVGLSIVGSLPLSTMCYWQVTLTSGTPATLPFGRQLNPRRCFGLPLGEMEDLAGISNVPPYQGRSSRILPGFVWMCKLAQCLTWSAEGAKEAGLACAPMPTKQVVWEESLLSSPLQ